MVKWFSVLILILVVRVGALGQKGNLMVEGISPKLYLTHKIAPKENFYSIGRMYNLPAKELAAYNNLQFENGLSIGQLIKIPLEESNFLQSGTAPDGDVLIPVYHAVVPKEGLYRMSINYNKVPLPEIKKWNHLQSDEVSIGTNLIIGYLKVKKGESPLAAKASKTDIDRSIEKSEEPKTPPPVNPDANHDRLPPVKKSEPEKKENSEAVIEQRDERGADVRLAGGRRGDAGAHGHDIPESLQSARGLTGYTGSGRRCSRWAPRVPARSPP